ncbi:NAD(P)/FAD-dependent oxidoreductase [Hyalangium rubrum]|uniref:FAD-binding oxidoreductase n=1 Tax=Hyalangium rubrum TaxID=3103134 RepID=A0ABU5HDW5_9BACT|nr:FAD-binding oxidoreductase [Hyalangium sp. s54d21]MDY7231668.1 FAD-binding oxidoreductase [Hyalangium sp. s54d21]
MTAADAARDMVAFIQEKAGLRELNRHDIAELSDAAAGLVDAHGRVTPALQELLYTVESTFRSRFDASAAAAFQSWVARMGARMRGPITLPEEETPYWQLLPNPLADFRSTPRLPEEVDLLIIGAGLTGASAAYHAVELARAGQRVAVIDMADPASQASGRNGGNFELIPENFLGPYEGLVRERFKYLQAVYPDCDEATLQEQADRQARLVVDFGKRNSRRFTQLVTQEGIDCDFSPLGWLRIAETAEEEAALAGEVALVGDEDLLVYWSKEKIFAELGLRAYFGGRCAPRSGNYHPRKFVCGVLQKAIARGVGLYTRVRVDNVVTGAGPDPIVCTAEGDIRARRVIVATNAFTSHLFPELEKIECYQSQILNLEHVEDRLKGMTVTEKKGDLYYNFPQATRYVDDQNVRRGMLHVGGGLDRPAPAPEDLQRSNAVLGLVKAGTDRRFPDTRGQPPSRVWTGPMAFTPDRMPAIGFFRRTGADPRSLIVAAGFNGYGGSYCVEAGYTAVELARTGQVPPEVPEDVFSPQRFQVQLPLFPLSPARQTRK